MNYRVLQGLIDVAGQASRYSQALKKKGCYSEAWFYERVLKTEDYTRLLDFSNSGFFGGRLRRAKYFSTAVMKFNILHIHKGFSFFQRSMDLAIAKRLNRTIVIHYRGREIRPEMQLVTLPDKIIDKVKRETEYADLVFVKDGQLAELISPFVKKPIVFPNIVDTSDFVPSAEFPDDFFDTSRRLRIVHIASNPKYKGTDLIKDQLYKIKDRVDFVELRDLSHRDLLEQYWRADIIVDQVSTGTFGNSSLEAMALARGVLCNLNPTFTKYEPGSPPIINSEKDRIADTLLNIDKNRNILFDHASRGKEYVKKFHTYDVVGEKLIGYYKSVRPC